MTSSLKILVVRTDRLGDLMMTLPCLFYLRRVFPEAKIDLNCHRDFHELLEGLCTELNIGLVSSVETKYDACLFLQGSSRELWSIYQKRISHRVGLYSKPLSFLLLNGGLRQQRSQSGRNEAESNLELAELLAQKLGHWVMVNESKMALPTNSRAQEKVQQILFERGVVKTDSFFIVHPGMRGSALNVSVETYLSLMNELESQGNKVVLSVGPAPRDLEIRDKILELRPETLVISGLSLRELAECFRLAKGVLAPSTGTLHLAHWVGIPTIGLFSPVRSQHPNRWAPWGGKVASILLLPKVNCPASTKCLGASCLSFDCMKKADWKDLLLRCESV
jgi:ADP-heptose:LPS heptosyltransferase